MTTERCPGCSCMSAPRAMVATFTAPAGLVAIQDASSRSQLWLATAETFLLTVFIAWVRQDGHLRPAKQWHPLLNPCQIPAGASTGCYTCHGSPTAFSCASLVHARPWHISHKYRDRRFQTTWGLQQGCLLQGCHSNSWGWAGQAYSPQWYTQTLGETLRMTQQPHKNALYHTVVLMLITWYLLFITIWMVRPWPHQFLWIFLRASTHSKSWKSLQLWHIALNTFWYKL